MADINRLYVETVLNQCLDETYFSGLVMRCLCQIQV